MGNSIHTSARGNFHRSANLPCYGRLKEEQEKDCVYDKTGMPLLQPSSTPCRTRGPPGGAASVERTSLILLLGLGHNHKVVSLHVCTTADTAQARKRLGTVIVALGARKLLAMTLHIFLGRLAIPVHQEGCMQYMPERSRFHKAPIHETSMPGAPFCCCCCCWAGRPPRQNPSLLASSLPSPLQEPRQCGRMRGGRMHLAYVRGGGQV